MKTFNIKLRLNSLMLNEMCKKLFCYMRLLDDIYIRDRLS